MPRRGGNSAGKGRKSRGYVQVSKRRGVVARDVAQTNKGLPFVQKEKTIRADGRCLSAPDGKLGFKTEEKAKAALAQAQSRRLWQNTKHVEKRYYPCPKCGMFHLTSQDVCPKCTKVHRSSDPCR